MNLHELNILSLATLPQEVAYRLKVWYVESKIECSHFHPKHSTNSNLQEEVTYSASPNRGIFYSVQRADTERSIQCFRLFELITMSQSSSKLPATKNIMRPEKLCN